MRLPVQAGPAEAVGWPTQNQSRRACTVWRIAPPGDFPVSSLQRVQRCHRRRRSRRRSECYPALLLQLGHALQASAAAELGRVQGKQAVRRVASWLKLVPHAMARWEEQQRRAGSRASGGRDCSDAAPPPPSPGPSPSRRGKRKTPERPQAVPCRFASACSGGGPAGSPAAGSEPLRRSCASSQEEPVSGTTCLQPKQLCFKGTGAGGHGSMPSAAARHMAEWEAFKVLLASLSRHAGPAPGAAAWAAPAPPAAAATSGHGAVPALQRRWQVCNRSRAVVNARWPYRRSSWRSDRRGRRGRAWTWTAS